MFKEIVIDSSTPRTKVAISEDGNLVEFYIEEPEKRKMVGDIYLGKVARVLPGIKAAFIDIGMKHDGFLHFSDISERVPALQGIIGDDEKGEIYDDEESDDESVQNEEIKNNFDRKKEHSGKKYEPPKLHKGEQIIVQITKEPIGNKGVRLTTAISLPGRFCVLLPFDNKIGISKKIYDYKERKRLRFIARSIIPRHFGLIIRTAAKDQPEDSLSEDLRNLLKTWQMIENNIKFEKPPALLYQDLNITSSVFRDYLNSDVQKVIIDNRRLYRQIRNYFQIIQPAFLDRIELYKGSGPIFETFKIEEQINALFSRKVDLPSGGYLIIEQTEAMAVFDVNSGRYAAKKEQEQNSLKTDLEAAREIVRQLRLRDIGGLIVCDFIDLEDEKNRKKVFDELKKEFKKDRAKASVLPMTEFGLIQITRQRFKQNSMESIREVCPYCLGTGLMTKQSSVLREIDEKIEKYRRDSGQRYIAIEVHPGLARKLKEGFFSYILKIQIKRLMRVKIIENDKLTPTSFRLLNKQNEDVANPDN